MNKTKKLTIILMLIIACTSIISAERITDGSAQIYKPDYQTFNSQRGLDTTNFWGINQQQSLCQAGQDMLIEIPSGSCSPSIVRSDLLESQNVPIFCPVVGIKTNPLIDIGQIGSVSFAAGGQMPEGVAGISFYPYRAATTQNNELFSTPGLANLGNNLGYVVVVLKQVPSEKNLSDLVVANLVANIQYDIKKVFGSGRTEYYVQAMTDEEWKENYKEYGIFKGQEYLRLEQLSTDTQQATIGVYNSKEEKITSVNLKLGEDSPLINLPGFYCGAGVRIKYTGSETPRKKIQLQIDQDTIWLHEGEKFLNEQCIVRSIEITEREKNNGLEKTIARINCPRGNYDLELAEINPSVGTQNINWATVLANIKDDQTKKQIIDNFEKAKEEAYLEADLYTSEKRQKGDNQEGQYYGLTDLQTLAKKAEQLGQYKTEVEIQEKIISKYSGTTDEETAQRRIKELKNYTYEKANVITTVDFSSHTITLKNYKKPAISEASAEFDRPVEPRRIGDYIYTTNETAGEAAESWLRIREIKTDSIILQGRITETIMINGKEQKNVRSGDYTMLPGQTISTIQGLNMPSLIGGRDGNNVQLKKINLKTEIKIQAVPEIKQTGTSANFTFAIGIEKRGIKTSPDKTIEMIENINKSIEKFSQITERLGKAVETGKAACLAGSATLFIKNFIANTGGAAGARTEVMSGQGGWYQKCNKLLADQPTKYHNLNDCLLENNGQIQEDINTWVEAEKNTNTQFDEVYNKDNITGSQQEFIKRFANNVCGEMKGKKVVVDGQEKIICGSDGVFKDQNAVMEAYNRGAFTITDAKQVMTASQTYGGADKIDDSSNTLGAQRLAGFYSNMYRRPEITSANYAGALGTASGKVFSSYSPDSRVANIEVVQVKTGEKLGGKIDVPEGNYALVSVAPGTKLTTNSQNLAGKVMVVPVTTDAQGNVNLDTNAGTDKRIIIDTNGKQVGNFEPEQYNEILGANKISSFKSVSESQSSCNNYYKEPKIKYFTSGQYSGLPAVVPIDQARGWYVATKDSELAPYTEAGQVRTFWICNVGKDGKEQFDTNSDDKYTCFQVNADRGTPLDQSYCFNAAETTQIINKAQEAIRQAGKYDQGRKQMSILGSSPYNIERVASSAPGTQCTDFMSPSDCNIMFNLCDPVICPASRCDLGGTYRVDDVVQSGIAGSIALCLPNAKEGIYVPVCLSGIYAGFDAYTSVLKAHRDCLQNSLETGQQVGICDEVKSVYMCEFFWRQVTPIIKAGIPKLIEGIFGSNNARAGGEYSNFQKAFSTADQSVNYFTQTYGQNAFSAFKIRSTSDIGSEICRQFSATNYPDGGNLIDAMIKPESPVQFFAQFDEIPFSEASVPPTSQYNVFYHIYAGKEKGTYFTIYLKNPPQNGLYSSAETIVINQGFIPAGQYDSQKIEKTLPSGYRELCVNINGKDECGFGKVTTDFGVNYLSDKYAEEQASNQKIETEEQCINGDSSIYSLTNPNIEEGADSLLNPAIYQQGIIRMCSSQNPGQNAGDNTGLATIRWKDVGYCTDKKIRCWLDTNSVKEVIKNKQIQNQTIEAVSAQLDAQSPIQADQKIKDVLGIINAGVAAMPTSQFFATIIDPMTEIEQSPFPSFTKAYAVDTKFQAFIKIIVELFTGQIQTTISSNVANATATIKKDCTITGYVPAKTKLAVGEQTFIKVSFTGQCTNWDKIAMTKVPGDTQPTYTDLTTTDKQKGSIQINGISFNQDGVYYLDMGTGYQDSAGQKFSQVDWSGRGRAQFEVGNTGATSSLIQPGQTTGAQDCTVDAYDVQKTVSMSGNKNFDMYISITGPCTNWNQLSIESVPIDPNNKNGINYNPISIKDNLQNAGTVYLNKLVATGVGEYTFKISPITKDLSSLQQSKFYQGTADPSLSEKIIVTA